MFTIGSICISILHTLKEMWIIRKNLLIFVQASRDIQKEKKEKVVQNKISQPFAEIGETKRKHESTVQRFD